MTEPKNKWFTTTNMRGRPLHQYNTTFGQLKVAKVDDDTYSVYFAAWTDREVRCGQTSPELIKTGVKQLDRAKRIARNWHKKEFKQ
ncbi:MAG: hypothetical protein K0U41_03545 [Gammaproteobacteria bacterium]|nr:hypothetical protein [Gammaproteobacteria bacterium]